MSNPEQDPTKIAQFPLERARIQHLDVGLYNLRIARNFIQPEIAPTIPFFQSPQEIARTRDVAISASDTANLASIREQIEREAA